MLGIETGRSVSLQLVRVGLHFRGVKKPVEELSHDDTPNHKTVCICVWPEWEENLLLLVLKLLEHRLIVSLWSLPFEPIREWILDEHVEGSAWSLMKLVQGIQSILVATVICPQSSCWIKSHTPSQKEQVHNCMDGQLRGAGGQMGKGRKVGS